MDVLLHHLHSNLFGFRRTSRTCSLLGASGREGGSRRTVVAAAVPAATSPAWTTREYIDPDRGARRDRCFAGLPVVEMRQLGPSLIERRNNAAALWRPVDRSARKLGRAT